MIAFLHSLSAMSTGVKISIAVVAVIVITGLLVLGFVGVSHAQSEFNGDDDGGGL